MIIPNECQKCKYFLLLTPKECSKYCKKCKLNTKEAEEKC